MRESGKTHFTLIELLIVISIIAILAGLLLPALKNARSTGLSIVCKGNLKQIGSALTNYPLDFNDKFMWAKTPYTAYWNGDVSGRPWYELLGKLGPYSQLDYGVKIGIFAKKTSSYERNILCPVQNDASFTYTDYACNRWFFGIQGSGTYKNHSLTMMQQPTQVALVFDNGYYNDHSVSYAYLGTFTAYGGFCIRSNHLNSANFLMGDMHVESMKRDTIGIGSSVLVQGFISSQGYE